MKKSTRKMNKITVYNRIYKIRLYTKSLAPKIEQELSEFCYTQTYYFKDRIEIDFIIDMFNTEQVEKSKKYLSLIE